MKFDPQAVFANLAEKEKIRGHHSPEGRAIRTLSRTLSGWSSGALSGIDVLVLCDQAIEDWLKSRLKVPSWSSPASPRLGSAAVGAGWLSPRQAAELKKLHANRTHARESPGAVSAEDAESALQFSIELVEKHW